MPIGLKLDKYSGLDWRASHELMVPKEIYNFGPLQLGLMCAAEDGHGPGTGVDSMHFVCKNNSKTEIISDLKIAIRTSHESKYYIIGHTPSDLFVPEALGPGTSVATMWFYVWPYWNAEEHMKETFNVKLLFWPTYNISYSGNVGSWDETVTMDPPDLGDKEFIDYEKKNGGPHA